MTLEQIKAERQLLEAQVDQAVAQFKKRCGLEDWQVTVAWGPVKVSNMDGSPAPTMHTATVSVRV